MSDRIKTVITEAFKDAEVDCTWTPEGHADHALAALKAAGIVTLELPSVAHKGPHDTDAKFYRQVADRMEKPRRRVDELSGSNVRHAVRELLYRAAAAAEASR